MEKGLKIHVHIKTLLSHSHIRELHMKIAMNATYNFVTIRNLFRYHDLSSFLTTLDYNNPSPLAPKFGTIHSFLTETQNFKCM